MTDLLPDTNNSMEREVHSTARPSCSTLSTISRVSRATEDMYIIEYAEGVADDVARLRAYERK